MEQEESGVEERDKQIEVSKPFSINGTMLGQSILVD